MLSVTLKQLRNENACYRGYNNLIKTIEPFDYPIPLNEYVECNRVEPINLIDILKSDLNYVEDAVWVFSNCFDDTQKYLHLLCNDLVLLLDDKLTQDDIHALDITKQYLSGKVDSDTMVTVRRTINLAFNANHIYDVVQCMLMDVVNFNAGAPDAIIRKLIEFDVSYKPNIEDLIINMWVEYEKSLTN